MIVAVGLRRAVVTLALPMTLVALAHAGYYSVTYTCSAPWVVSGIPSSVAATVTSVSGGFISITSPVQAVFTWNPTNGSDLPPNYAILRESASAGFAGISQPPNPPPGSASDGLGDSTSGNMTSVSGICYTIVPNPGETFYAGPIYRRPG